MNKKFIVGVIGGTILLLGLGVVVATNMSATSQAAGSLSNTGAKLELAERSHDWGNIPINGGKVEKVFEVKNSGTGVLELIGFETSCMCTTVQVKTSQGDSPLFGMHSNVSWKGRVNPGETAEVKVIFDPAFHGPQGRGAINRIIKFETNDPQERSVELTLTGTVI